MGWPGIAESAAPAAVAQGHDAAHHGRGDGSLDRRSGRIVAQFGADAHFREHIGYVAVAQVLDDALDHVDVVGGDQHQPVAQVVLRQLVGQASDGARQPLGRLGRAEDRGDARPLGRENTNDCRLLAQVKRELELCRFCIAEIDRNFSVSRKARFAESRAGLPKLRVLVPKSGDVIFD